MRISDWSSDVCSSDLHDAVVLELGDQLLLGCEGEGSHLHAVLDQQVTACRSVRGIGSQVDPERLVRARLDLEDRLLELLEGHRRAGQDPEATGVGRADDETRPGDSAHAGLHHRVTDAGELVQWRTQMFFGGHGAATWAAGD